MKILVTGAKGFVGKNFVLFARNAGHEVFEFDLGNTEEELKSFILSVDFIVHLAGTNRPLTKEEFYDGNANFTKKLVDLVASIRKEVSVIFSSSIQAELDNDYGKSKKMAEDYLFASPLTTYVYRLANVFGKWCRPNYNSVVATWCHNIANGLPIQISDPEHIVRFNYIDDICQEWISLIEGAKRDNAKILHVSPTYECSLERLSETLKSFKESREDFTAPNMSDPFTKKLYATYLSYLKEDDFSYPLVSHEDNRGSFTEFLRSNGNGQVSVNIAHPGIVKGNHYHHTKNEKFLVVAGKCLIKFRKIGTEKVIEYIVSGEKLEVVDIPTGYTHSITNIGSTDSVTIMWASEPFDKNNPDTYFEEV